MRTRSTPFSAGLPPTPPPPHRSPAAVGRCLGSHMRRQMADSESIFGRRASTIACSPRARKKALKKKTFFTPVPNADQAAASCTSPPTAAAGCHVVGTIVGHKKVLARRGRRFAMTEIEGRRSQGVPRRVLPTFEGEKTGGENAQARFLGWPPLPSLALPVVPGGHVTAHWPCSPPPPPRNGDRRKRSPLEKHAKTRQKRTPHRGKLPGELRAPLQCARDGALVAPHRPLSNATAPPRNGAGRRRSPRET